MGTPTSLPLSNGEVQTLPSTELLCESIMCCVYIAYVCTIYYLDGEKKYDKNNFEGQKYIYSFCAN